MTDDKALLRNPHYPVGTDPLRHLRQEEDVPHEEEEEFHDNDHDGHG